MTRFRIIFLFLLSGFLSEFVRGDAIEDRVMAYFKAFNSGDPAVMRKYFEENFSQKRLPEVSLEERTQRYERFWKEQGALEMQTIDISGQGEVTVVVRSKRGELLQYTFEIEPEPPNKIVGIRIEMGSDSQHRKEARKTNDADLLQAVSGYLEELSRSDEFSGVVLLAKNGKPMFQQAYGMANIETGTPNRTDTKFNLGSINKIFTKIAVAQLLEQKKLELDQPVGLYLTDYPNRDVASRITIRQLIDMTSGMGDFFNEKYDALPKDRLRTLQDYVPLFVDEPLSFEPGSNRQYSNAGYVVLGLLIEKLSGENYYDYVRRKIFTPSGMTATDSIEADDPQPNVAEGYTREGCSKGATPCKRTKNRYLRPARGSSAGGGYSTAEDLLRFTIAIKNNKLISADSPLNAGELGIAGGAPGTNALVEMSEPYTLIVLSNYDPPIAENIGRRIREWLPE